MAFAKHRIWFVAALLWSALILLIALESVHYSDRAIYQLAEAEAKASYEKDMAYRSWVAMHGGVYAPVSEVTQPNPFLKHVGERDIVTPSGRQLTLVNPGYMTRQVYELANEKYGVKGHLTSLMPIRSENSPDPWEAAALTALKQGQSVESSLDDSLGEPYLRMMYPLYIEESCLPCHASQGYAVGDLRGGISVSVPYTSYHTAFQAAMIKIVISLILVWLVGMVFILFIFRVVRKQFRAVEAALEEADALKRNYQTLFDQATGGICVADVVTGEILDSNQRMLDLLGCAREGLIGQPETTIEFSLNDERLPREMEGASLLHQAEAIGDVVEMQLQTDDGRVCDVQAKASRLVIDGREVLQGFFYDITRQKELQSQAIRTAQLASLGELSAGVAHEINNPIGGVINYAQLLLNRGVDNSFQQEVLQKIIHEGTRIAVIVKSLLSFSRSAEEKSIVTDLRRIIEESLTLVKAQLAKDGITVEVDVPSSLPPIRCNTQQMEQLALNLVNNARHALIEKAASSESRIITISAGARQDEDDCSIELVFVDNGCGIPAERLGKVMRPFYTTKEVGVGTGLGLSICEEIVSSHGGRLQIESEVGSYTRVAICLPVEQRL
jgi:PAS domain S-box-containing protein